VNLAEQLESLKGRGFSRTQSEVIVLMREAAILIFRAWPDSFILYGGANLVLFHNSVRHSADLDLLIRSGTLPTAPEIQRILTDGLKPLGKLLNLDLIVTQLSAVKLAVITPDRRTLFTVDLSKMGSVIQSGIEEHAVEALGAPDEALIRSVSRDHQLFQKAEVFLFRTRLKARDAYDIWDLLNSGAKLTAHLKEHLDDRLWGEMDSEAIRERIESVTEKLCRAELKEVLPEEVHENLAKVAFEPLRDGLSELFKDWL
jgi:Nucleotidyl transferase AbiEii toxin, Type IV TA system